MNENLSCETAIIGGGLSALFLATMLARDRSHNFKLVVGPKARLGGYAAWGYMKLGMPPAGRRTSEWLSEEFYANATAQFLEGYRQYLQPAASVIKLSKNIPILHSTLYQKNYDSYVVSLENTKSLFANILDQVGENVIWDEAIGFARDGSNYFLNLSNGSILRCTQLVIATGRNPKVSSMLRSLGQTFQGAGEILIGCRVTFDPVPLERTFSQLDLRLTHENLCQTYCFNYRGRLHTYEYSGIQIYTGTLNPQSTLGNTFIGMRVRSDAANVLELCRVPKSLDAVSLESCDYYPSGIMEPITKFMELLRRGFGFRFYQLYFPALEQFWPKPLIKQQSLESANLGKLFFIGDASGVSFGLLQCYVTAARTSKNLRI